MLEKALVLNQPTALIQNRAVATLVPDDSVMVQFMQRKNPREETSSCKYMQVSVIEWWVYPCV